MADNKNLDFAQIMPISRNLKEKPGVLRKYDENCMPHLSLCPLFYGAGNADIVDCCNKLMGVPPFVETTKPNQFVELEILNRLASYSIWIRFNISL
ncbi:unnamed protein product [Caenorhabditis angaria]|uniref:Uncharacterized protein n=1 Tax=Caenorhabditis angaria TaxID=860376 RepID=A0A9P1IM72_9PELO|nr:unnamed protein product [Caenorhabditis angaria]